MKIVLYLTTIFVGLSTSLFAQAERTFPTIQEVNALHVKQVSANALAQKISGVTVKGEYIGGYRYIAYLNPDGTVEGRNHVGSHHFGTWKIDDNNHTLQMKWDGWANTITKAYEIEGKIHFFDVDSNKWRTVFTDFTYGEQPLIISK